MRVSISLDTFSVITQPSPARAKAGGFVPVEISFTRGTQAAMLPEGAVLEFAIKPRNQWSGGLLVYHNAFSASAGTLYAATVNFASAALLNALGLADQAGANGVPRIEASAEVAWSVAGQKFRSTTFPITIETPLIDGNPTSVPDPETYPPPSDLERASRKGQPNGYAPLDATARLPAAYLPALGIADIAGLAAALAALAEFLNPDDGRRYRLTVSGDPPTLGLEEIPIP